MSKLFLFFFFFLPIISLASEREFSGEILFSKDSLYKNEKIRILPGTRIIIPKDSESGLIFENCQLKIEGTEKNPIIIEGVGKDDNLEDNNLIYMENCKGIIKHVKFRNGPWLLHIHNSELIIEKSIFENSFGGIRFTGENIKIEKNLFKNNKIAVRSINSSPKITTNIFLNNDIAIFFRQGIQTALIKDNIFLENKYDLYMGFFQFFNLNCVENFFVNEPSIFDGKKDGDIKAYIYTEPTKKSFPNWH